MYILVDFSKSLYFQCDKSYIFTFKSLNPFYVIYWPYYFGDYEKIILFIYLFPPPKHLP